jgi:hypothetical protein
MADASSTSSGGLAEPQRRGTRKWVSLLAELPYFAIVAIASLAFPGPISWAFQWRPIGSQ